MRVHHIGYLVRKVERAAQTLEALGYVREGNVTRDEFRGIDILFLVNGETRVELVAPYAEDSAVGELKKRVGNAPYHICYISDDLDADVARMTENGYVLTSPANAAPAIGGNRVAFLMNAAIGLIELVEHVK